MINNLKAVFMLVILSGIFGIAVYSTLPDKLRDNSAEMTRPQMVSTVLKIDQQLQVAAQTLEAEDAALVTAALVGQPAPPTEPPATTPRIGLCLTHLWSTVEPATEIAIEDAAKRLTEAGALLGDAVLPAGFEALSEARETFNEFERARAACADEFIERDGRRWQRL